MACGRLAEHLFRSGKSEVERGACGSAEGAGSDGQNHGGNGAAVHFEQSGCEHHDSRNAKVEECGSELRCERCRAASRGTAQEVARTSLGPQPDFLVAIGTVLSRPFRLSVEREKLLGAVESSYMSGPVKVQILGQPYTIQGELDEAYV